MKALDLVFRLLALVGCSGCLFLSAVSFWKEEYLTAIFCVLLAHVALDLSKEI